GAPVRHEFSGRVEGDSISGTARLSGNRIQAQLEWTAQRASKAAAREIAPATASLLLLSPQ
ncbi:MAG: hypothetical protein HY526_00630, partial [Betaproteobacteria bacterium]|nr:hypothetical protein [Betaproteobacteria bacterium]